MYLSLYANEKGEVLEHPNILMLGRSGSEWLVPEASEMMPLPRGASLVRIPGNIPVGLDMNERLAYFEFDPLKIGQRAYAVAALLPQGFTRTLLPACVGSSGEVLLPLLGYAAVALKEGKIYVAAVQSDEHRKWHPRYFNTERLPLKINKMLKKYPQNRILHQLARCSLEYSCFTAQNIFYQRWEGGIPTMKACNAACIACISEDHCGTTSPQNRLDFIPTVQEISEVASEHLLKAREAIISFGQGCEGEPALNGQRLSQAIHQIRDLCSQGTINMNTNAGYCEGVKLMTDAGMDSMRITIFSAIEENYDLYHRPQDYSLADVEYSIAYARDRGVKISLNLLAFPGFSDRKEEIEALMKFVSQNQVDMIQLRNLNIDPEFLMRTFPGKSRVLGISNFIKLLKTELPGVKIGSYSHPVR
ncbi:MAG: radical SAM protein [Syntrophomonas sp.]|uniref:radical SAM protein n=1 Tax=Syntrophomonas sp. TaxID=2053627 RepID=UPI002602F16B|nr:radical SAM protein [Syntrophomonas sp.]MDD2509518.1 radical SAM protein [Syntrophomonas sp.]MDD3878389.1 radical SAM protein [Syntrophomonas sp.]MDD4625512.1 radical SAM protein [Syntrophomonas sp.]